MILGLGRALGETMAVTMVIGNQPQIVASLLKPGYTLASVIANEFGETTTNLYSSALFEIGLVLLGVTVCVNIIAQLLLKTFPGRASSRKIDMTAPNHNWRKFKNAFMQTLTFVCAILVIMPLLLVFYHLIKEGFTSINRLSSRNCQNLKVNPAAA